MTWWTVAIGVDTHKQAHVAVALDRLGRLIGSLTVPATMVGYRQLLVWAHGLGQPTFGIEGCGSYGAGLARFLTDHDETVFGVRATEASRAARRQERPDRRDLSRAPCDQRRWTEPAAR